MTPEASETRTTCPYCGVGCGVIATRRDDGSIGVRGDPEHPANFGRLCSKGSALAETLSLDDRLLRPEIGGRPAAWDEALDLVARRFAETIAEHGPDSVAFYVSGQLLTEDYYVANKLMKGFIGSANIDTNSRLCMSSSVAGHRRAFGSDTVPGCYDDLEAADLVVLVGSNLAWCHPVLYQRLMAARQHRGTRIVVIDPRRTATAETADGHLAIAPDSDVALFGGLLSYLHGNGCIDADFVAAHTSGLDVALDAVADLDPAKTARLTGIPEADLVAFFAEFAATDKAVTVYSQGVNQSVFGSDKVNAILNCHLATGRIGREGMGPFSVTGQPNAMGGREVGGLANVLAAHMSLDSPTDRAVVQTFWASPRVAEKPGLKAVELFRAIGDGRVKAVWIIATNPVDSLPDADSVGEALTTCPFVVVSDVIRSTDTTALAHVLLPAAAWGEKSGTVTNSERRISRQRAFLDLPGEARPDWWMIAEVARRMGHAEGFDFASPAAIFREHAALSGFRNDGSTRAFDIGAYADVSDADYDALEPVQWPAKRHRSGEPPVDGPGPVRFYSAGGFHTPDRRGRFVATPHTPSPKAPSAELPFVLNTGRIRDQWHTMTRTGKTPRLMSQFAESFCEIHPQDAARLGIGPADLVELASPSGRVVARALVTDRQRPGEVFVPMHWTGQFSGAARIDTLVDARTDAVSGQPGSKYTAVAVNRFAAHWYGFGVSLARPEAGDLAYWARARSGAGYRLECAGSGEIGDVEAMARQLLCLPPEAEVVRMHDRDRGIDRLAAFVGARLVGAFFAGPQPVEAARDWLIVRLGSDLLPRERARLLAGRAAQDDCDPGATVCACFSVGINQIAEAVVSGGARTVAEVGEVLRAGSNCGSCRPEIARIIERETMRQAAE
ncbi:MAG: molybdopterin-dependent oxidoreductase [Ancalomicrobiaceae bacterium]|nr:molybdopterin-dependent oxidoreductase [Ancalomicrobiaceae bacterium]